MNLAQAAAQELFEFHGCVWMSPEKLAEALGIHPNTVLREIRRETLPAVALGHRIDGAPGKPYRIFRCQVALWFGRCPTLLSAADRTSPPRKERPQPSAGASGCSSPRRPRPPWRPEKVDLVQRRQEPG